VELRRQQALELPTAPRPLIPALLGALVLAGAAHAAVPTTPVYDERGNLVGTPFAPQPEEPLLSEEEAIGRALAHEKIADWLDRYPKGTLTEEASFDEDIGVWEVNVWSELPEAGQVALAKVDDTSGAVTEAWTGPQVAWKMARGYDGAFGRKINNPWIWGSLSVVFFLGLANLRRPLSIRNLDLLVLLSFGISLYFFNQGAVFTAMPLAYPPLLYLLGRMAWIGWKGQGSTSRALWPVWVLLAATVFLAGFRFGLNLRASNVIDVGLAGVNGAQRIVEDGQSPYGNMPDDVGEECGEPDAEGYVRERIQTNGRCEVANGRGDTYGPFSYLAYVPGFVTMGYDYEWDYLPAAHFTSLLWDALALIGLGVLGFRFGGVRLGATLAFAWAAYPFTQYVSSSNSNDAIMPALLIWGLVFVTSPPARGLFAGLATWTKFASLVLLPLWASYPKATKWPRQQLLFLGGVVLATALSFWVLLLEPDPLHAARLFWDRTFGWQLSRPSPFSIWDWDEYPGFPDLYVLQTVLKGVLVAAAGVLAFVPRTRNVVQLAALTAALLIGFELVLTHWFYLYIPWFFPFVAFAVLVPAAVRVTEPQPLPEDSGDERQVGELVPIR
jgi:hypothetical protein